MGQDCIIFVCGILIGFMGALSIMVVILRRWMISSGQNGQNEQMVNHLVVKLARTDGDRMVYRKALEKVTKEKDRLMDEKLRNWDVPEYF